MNKATRETVRTRVLTESFEPRFNAIQARLRNELTECIKLEHPWFVEAAADPERRKYLAIVSFSDFRWNGCRIGVPRFNMLSTKPDRTYLIRSECTAITAGHVAVPSVVDSYNASHGEDYDKAWSDYTEAYGKLTALLNSYKSRDKFAADWPDFAKHLPERADKPNLPMVIVSDVRSDLEVLGVL